MSGVYHGIYVYNKQAYINYDVLCKSIVINYVSKYQLPHVVNAFHTMPIIHVNCSLMLLKLTMETLFVF